jgi:hypothetical protein
MRTIARLLTGLLLAGVAVLGFAATAQAQPAEEAATVAVPMSNPCPIGTKGICEKIGEKAGDTCKASGLPDAACDGLTTAAHAVGNVTPMGLMDTATDKAKGAASGALKNWVAENGPQAWAKSVALSSSSLLAKLQKKLLEVSKPNLMQDALSVPYGVAWMFGIIFAAFAQLRAVAGMANATPEAREAVRDATSWSAFYVVGVSAIPVLLMGLVDLSWLAADKFGMASREAAANAITTFIDMLNNLSDPDQQIAGGVISLLGFGLMIWVGAALAIVELVIAKFGFYVLACALPLFAGVAVFPSWRRPFYAVIGTITAIIITPMVLFFTYWIFWSTVGLDSADAFEMLLYMAVVGLIVSMAPLALAFLLPMLIPAGSGAAAAASMKVRQVGGAGGRAASRQTSRMLQSGRRNPGGNRSSTQKQRTAGAPKPGERSNPQRMQNRDATKSNPSRGQQSPPSNNNPRPQGQTRPQQSQPRTERNEG